MQDFASGLPKTDALKRGLASALQSEDVGGRFLTLLGREPTPYATTFPCEIVTCRIGRGKPRRLFCKYTAGGDYTGHGHRGGVGDENATYPNILARASKFRVTAVESRTERACPRQDVRISSDLVPHATSMPVTRVVTPRRVLAEESARLPAANPAGDNLAWKGRCVRRGFTAQKSEEASANIFALQGRSEASL